MSDKNLCCSHAGVGAEKFMIVLSAELCIRSVRACEILFRFRTKGISHLNAKEHAKPWKH